MDSFSERLVNRDVSSIEKVLQSAAIVDYSVFSFGSCNTEEFNSKYSDVDIGILLPFEKEKLDKWNNAFSPASTKVQIVHWVYSIDNFLDEKFDSPVPDHPSDFEKWGELAKWARVKYMARTFNHLGGKSIEDVVTRYKDYFVPPEEGIELFVVCTRDLARGIYEEKDSKLAKAMLRSIDALHIAAGYNSLNNYGEMKAAGKRLLPAHSGLIDQAYAVKIKGTTFRKDSKFLENVENFFKDIKSNINRISAESGYQFDYKRSEKIAKWILGSEDTKGTAEGIADLIANKYDPTGAYLPFAQFYMEELISASKKKKAALSDNMRSLLGKIDSRLGANLHDVVVSANIALVTKTPDNAQAVLDAYTLMADADLDDLVALDVVSAEIDVGKGNYFAAAKHYESALKKRPWNSELAWKLKQVYRQAPDDKMAAEFKTIYNVINGKSVYDLPEVPETVKVWLGWLRESLREGLFFEIKQLCDGRLQKFDSQCAKSKVELDTIYEQQSLRLEATSKCEQMLVKIKGPIENTVPIYKAFLNNKKASLPHLYELDVLLEEINKPENGNYA